MTVWKTIDGWTYEYFDRDTPASRFPGFEEVINLWNSKRTGPAMPAWSNFDFYDFEGWHGRINLTTVTLDPFDYKYEIFGSKSVEVMDVEWTGKSGRVISQAHEQTDLELEFHEMVARNGYISYSSGLLPWTGRGHRQAEFLELPLSDNGITLTHALEIIL